MVGGVRNLKLRLGPMYQFVKMNEIVQGSHSTNASNRVCRRLFFLDLLVYFFPANRPSWKKYQPSRCLEGSELRSWGQLGYLESLYNT